MPAWGTALPSLTELARSLAISGDLIDLATEVDEVVDAYKLLANRLQPCLGEIATLQRQR